MSSRLSHNLGTHYDHARLIGQVTIRVVQHDSGKIARKSIGHLEMFIMPALHYITPSRLLRIPSAYFGELLRLSEHLGEVGGAQSEGSLRRFVGAALATSPVVLLRLPFTSTTAAFAGHQHIWHTYIHAQGEEPFSRSPNGRGQKHVAPAFTMAMVTRLAALRREVLQVSWSRDCSALPGCLGVRACRLPIPGFSRTS